jgi:hypothetical protein
MIKKVFLFKIIFSSALLVALAGCSTPGDRTPQSETNVRRQFNRFELMHPLKVQNTTAYTVETVFLASNYCRVSVTLPPGEEFQMNARENLLVTAYTVSSNLPSQEVKVDFLPVKKRPLKMRCQFPVKPAGYAEQKVAAEFKGIFLTYYAGKTNEAYTAEYKKAASKNASENLDRPNYTEEARVEK